MLVILLISANPQHLTGIINCSHLVGNITDKLTHVTLELLSKRNYVREISCSVNTLRITYPKKFKFTCSVGGLAATKNDSIHTFLLSYKCLMDLNKCNNY